MAKAPLYFENHEESERYLLEQSVARTPEERLRWLFRQIEITKAMNPKVKETTALMLKRKELTAEDEQTD